MTATTVTRPITVTQATATTHVWRALAVATVIAAAATEALVGVARAAGVDVAIQGETLTPGGCTVAVLLCVVAAAGLLAGIRRWAANPVRTWVRVTVTLTALSFVPDVLVPDTATSSRLVLIAAHVLAAAVVIPAVARRLPSAR